MTSTVADELKFPPTLPQMKAMPPATSYAGLMPHGKSLTSLGNSCKCASVRDRGVGGSNPLAPTNKSHEVAGLPSGGPAILVSDVGGSGWKSGLVALDKQ